MMMFSATSLGGCPALRERLYVSHASSASPCARTRRGARSTSSRRLQTRRAHQVDGVEHALQQTRATARHHERVEDGKRDLHAEIHRALVVLPREFRSVPAAAARTRFSYVEVSPDNPAARASNRGVIRGVHVSSPRRRGDEGVEDVARGRRPPRPNLLEHLFHPRDVPISRGDAGEGGEHLPVGATPSRSISNITRSVTALARAPGDVHERRVQHRVRLDALRAHVFPDGQRRGEIRAVARRPARVNRGGEDGAVRFTRPDLAYSSNARSASPAFTHAAMSDAYV